MSTFPVFVACAGASSLIASALCVMWEGANLFVLGKKRCSVGYTPIEVSSRFLSGILWTCYGFLSYTYQSDDFATSLFCAAFLAITFAGLLSCIIEAQESAARRRTSLQRLDSSLTYGSMFVLAVLLSTIISFVSGTSADSSLTISAMSAAVATVISVFAEAHRRLRSDASDLIYPEVKVRLFSSLCGSVCWMFYGATASIPLYVFAAVQLLSAVVQFASLALSIADLRIPLVSDVTFEGFRLSLWGRPPLYQPTVEDKANLWDITSYGWVGSFATKAAAEALPLHEMPPPMEELRAWNAGTATSKEVLHSIQRRRLWEQLVDLAEVRLRDGSEAKGVLRWVGTLPRLTEDIMVAVEWTVAGPPLAGPFSVRCPGGIWEGQTLFQPQHPLSTSTCERACDVLLVTESPSGEPLTLHDPPERLSVTRALFTATWNSIWMQVPFRVLADFCILSAPLLLEAFVKFLQSDSPSWSYGFLLVTLMFLLNLFQSSLLHRYYHLSIRAGITQRNALLITLIEKCMTISAKALTFPEMSPGRIVNMISTDAERFNEFQQFLLFFWSYPFQVVCGVVLLWRLVGWAAIGSILVLFVVIPLQKRVAAIQHKYRQELIAISDERVKLTNELFSGIRIVKVMGWEYFFTKRIQEKRLQELASLRNSQWCRILASLITAATPTLLVGVVFILYTLGGSTLSPQVVFPTISVLMILRIPFLQIPMLFTIAIQFQVSSGRISKFLECEDRDEDQVQSIEHWKAPPGKEKDPRPSIAFDHATIAAFLPRELPDVDKSSLLAKEGRTLYDMLCQRRSGDAAKAGKKLPVPPKTHELTIKPLLSDVTLTIPDKKFTVILGATGAGKSTLLESILGQLEVVKGNVYTSASVAYVPQQPWIMNANVRDNITFFRPLETPEQHSLFESAIATCELTTDLAQLAAGLDTEIGEKGVNLSGGQKARVSMARAVFAAREIYLMDDPLSALDAHVGANLLQNCILGSLAGTTRVLATHHLHVAAKADQLIVVDHGSVTFCGSYRQYIEFACLDRREEDEPERGPGSPVSPSAHSPTIPQPAIVKPTGPSQLLTKEEKASGSVPLSTYYAYLDACGGKSVAIVLLLIYFITEIVMTGNTMWLSMWSVSMFDLSQAWYLVWYFVIISLGVGATPLRLLHAYDAMRTASATLHSEILHSVIKAPMSFFDTTPLGRILNRFVQDIDNADNSLQMSYLSFLQLGFSTLSIVAMMLMSQPVAILAIIPTSLVYYRLLLFYNAANREARRVGNVAKSPVFSLLSEILGGSKTIRAYEQSNSVMREAIKRIDLLYCASYIQSVLNRWLGLRIELLGNVIVTTVALGTVLSKMWFVQNVAMLSLGLTMSMNITGFLNWIVRQVSAVESDMNSVERLLHYATQLPQEPLSVSTAPVTKIEETMTMEFDNVCLRYREDLPLVLNQLSFSIQPREKVAVVGRTGSGKSSLLLSFLRIVDISSGSIFLNGKRHSERTLEDLRSLFAMIPQDPLLFDGTVRSNLDPFNHNSDAELWEAIRLVGMGSKLQELGTGLESVVVGGGTNFSVGQRQLLCMARAVLKRGCSFILMDEATANVDTVLDRQIQHTVRHAFRDKTVITIAHRLNTIVDYNKIIVMEAGRAEEIGTPLELATNPNSKFRSLLESQEGFQELMDMIKKPPASNENS